jgi:pteridine reductase
LLNLDKGQAERKAVNLDGTVALVTGGARRVGRAVVLALARAGCDTAVHYHRSKPEAEDLAGRVADLGRRAVTVAGDLNDPSSWPKIVGRTIDGLGGLDVLVNNAAVFLTGLPDTVDDFAHERWEAILRTNLIAPMALCHEARPHLAARGNGKIVNLCDIAADRPWPDHLAYCASKAALAALTKGLALALAPKIQVNGIAPGIAVFPDEYPAGIRQRLTERVPTGREGTPGEVAELVRFLVESGDYITGQIVAIDGGRSIR